MKHNKMLSIAWLLALAMTFTWKTASNGDEQDQIPTIYGNYVDETRSWATLGRLYVIVATDDQVPEVGNIARKNGEIFEKVLKENLAQGVSVILKIPAENLSRETVFLVISNLSLRENDALLFYFSGKGGVDRKTGQFFQFSATGEDLFRSELQDAMNQRKHRMNVLISDFCDASAKSTTGAADSQKTVEAGDQPVLTSPLFFSLFFLAGGDVDLASSIIPGQASLPGENGTGCFTESLVGMLRANRCKKLSWSYFFPYFRDGTSLMFKQTYPDGTTAADGIQQVDQLPVAFALGQKKVVSPVFGRVYPQGFTATDNMPESSKQPTEEDRNLVTTLARKAVDELRPYRDRDSDTHENVEMLDTDNVVLGLNGKPFSHQVEPVVFAESNPVTESSPGTESDSTTAATTQEKPQEQKVRLGVQAANNNGDGVRITNVLAGYPAATAGLEAGDLILEINGKKITSEQDYSDAIDQATDKLEMLIRDHKSGRNVPLTISLK